MSLVTTKFSNRIRFRFDGAGATPETIDLEADNISIRVEEDVNVWRTVDGKLQSQWRGVWLFFDFNFRYVRKNLTATPSLSVGVVELFRNIKTAVAAPVTIEVNPFPDVTGVPFVIVQPVPGEKLFNILQRQRIGRSISFSMQSERLDTYPTWLEITK